MIYIIRNTLDDIFSNVLHSDKDLYIGCELKTKKSKKYERKVVSIKFTIYYDFLRKVLVENSMNSEYMNGSVVVMQDNAYNVLWKIFLESSK